MLNGLVRLVVGNRQFAVGPVVGIRLVVEATVGEGAAKLLVEEQEQEGDLRTFAVSR